MIGEPLGEGEFGRVVRARAYSINGRKGYKFVAVKMLKRKLSVWSSMFTCENRSDYGTMALCISECVRKEHRSALTQ